MKKYLITGCAGFVGEHFIDFFEVNNIRADVLGIDINPPIKNNKNYRRVKYNYKAINLLNKDKLKSLIVEFCPDYILHLASYSSVKFSWTYPLLCFQNNTNIFLNLIDIIREIKLDCRILSVGSCEEYGEVISDGIPIRETFVLSPANVYAVTRVAQEHLSRVFVNGYGLDIVMTRSFNHFGPGQKEIFVISSFAKQMVMIKKALKENKFACGNTRIIRDFLDVRDVVEAYYLLFDRGKSGEVYNVCSGNGIELSEVIKIMSDYMGIKIKIKHNPKLLRNNDSKIIIGSNEKIRQDIGWSPKIIFRESIKDILNYWENKLANEN